MAPKRVNIASALISALDQRYDLKRQITNNAVIESVARDNEGQVKGAWATIDGVPGVPLQVPYGAKVAPGMVYTAVNYGTYTAPNWIAIGAAASTGTPRITEIVEDTRIGDTLYTPGDALFGDITAGSANLFFDQSEGKLHLRVGTNTAILLDAINKLLEIGSNNDYKLTYDATTGILTVEGNIIANSGELGTMSVLGTLTVGSSSPQVIIDGANKLIRTSNFAQGSTGWRITGSGTAEFNSATVRGRVSSGSGNEIVIIDPNDATYRLWAGNADPASASFRVTKAGVLTATGATISGTITASAGAIGGWDISSSTISKNNAVLDSSGYIALGTGNDYARLDAVDSTYRLWIGNATASSAPFRVTKAGVLTATGATISGTITASAGSIGGWDISSSTISKNNAILDSAGAITLGTSNDIVKLSSVDSTYRLWVGNTDPASASFRVTKAGVLTATGATITGSISATSGTIGGWDVSTDSISKSNAVLHSTGYIALGTGNDYARLDAADSTYRLWIGNAVAGSAPFRVTKEGALTATGATISGTITASAGAVGGWDISSSAISKNNAVLDSSGYIALGAGNDYARLDAVDSTYRLWIGNATASSAPFRVTKAGAFTASNATITGSITSTSGSIGGWTIGSTTLTGGSTTLDSAGAITLGTSNDIVKLSSVGSTYRLWVGNTDPASASFRVTKAGVLTATGATISGTITASAGAIGGWDISSSTISKNYAVLDSAGAITLGTSNDIVKLSSVDGTYRLWVGNADPASASFRVTKAGVLTATGATISGDITANTGTLGTLGVTGTLTVGSSSPYILIDGSAKTIGSSNFASGTSGWRVSSDGTAEFMNVVARGVIRTPVFLKEEVASIGGTFLISSSDTLLADVTSSASFTFQTARGYFNINDDVRIKPDETRDNWWKITGKTGTGPYTYTASLQSGTAATFRAGEAVVSYGPSGAGLVRLTATETNAPFVSVFTHSGSPWSSLTERARLGNLSGITDAVFGSLSGFGLWTNNIYLTGAINATSGYIGGASNKIVIDSSGITVGNSGRIAGGQTAYNTGTGFWMGYDSTAYKLSIGNPSGNKLLWNGSTLSITGAITITSGSSGIANLSDAGALATKNTASLDTDVTDGSTYKRTTANEKTGAGRAYSALDANNVLVTGVDPTTNFGSAPSGGEGLYVGADYLGYYSGSAWKTYMDNQGRFYLSGTNGFLTWNPSTDSLSIKGSITITGGSGYANLTDKPTSLSGINSSEGSKLAGIEAGATVGATWGVNITNQPSNAQLLNNILDPSTWVLGSTGSQPGFNQNGTSSENYITLGVGPHGQEIIQWECRPDGGNNADGGWTTSIFTIDPAKTYRFTVWVKRTGSVDGATYLGCAANTVCNLSNGLPNNNPYFVTAYDPPQLDRWYLLVGYVFPSSHTGTSHRGGVYDGVTGAKVANATSFKWAASATITTQRCYFYYCATTTNRQYMWNPRVDLCDGNEPSIQALLSGAGIDYWRHSSDTTTIDGGKIYTGSISAEKISVDYLSALNSNMGTLTAGSIVIGDTNKLWLNHDNDGGLAIGGTDKANAPFRVTSAGVLTANDATVVGSITANSGTLGAMSVTGTLTVGSASPQVLIDGSAKVIKSSNFSSGATGWQIDSNGNAEFNNLVARGIVRAPMAASGDVSSIGGTVVIAPSDVLLANVTSSSSFTFQTARDVFAINEYVRIKPDGTRDNWWKITGKAGSGPYTYTASLQSGTAATFRAGETVVGYGVSGAYKIFLVGSGTNSPYIEVAGHSGAPWSTMYPSMRLGRLNGITDPVFGALGGYGLWTDNVYLTGKINATSGGVIAGWDIGTSTISKNYAVLDSAGAITLGTSNDIVKLSSVDSTYRLWVGNTDPASASFRVTKAGVLTATGATISGTITASAGSIGGWDISSSTISKNYAVLDSAGAITLGTSNDIVKLSSVNGTYRLWVGNADPASASFRVTKAGVLTATGATISGTITASAGAIGGWDVSSSTISKNYAVLDSAGAITLGTSNDIVKLSSVDSTYRLWVGNTDPASASFRVTKAGVLTATGATISGAITATSGSLGSMSVTGTLTVGSASPQVIIDGSTKVIKSSNYASGSAGWQIASSGSAEFNNATIRGKVVSGSSNNVVILDPTDATYRLWVGNATAASAPFRVTKAGDVTAQSITIVSPTVSLGSRIVYFPCNESIGSKVVSQTAALFVGHLSGDYSLGSGYAQLNENSGNYYRNSGGVTVNDPHKLAVWTTAGEVFGVQLMYYPTTSYRLVVFIDGNNTIRLYFNSSGKCYFEYHDGYSDSYELPTYSAWQTNSGVFPAANEWYAISFRWVVSDTDQVTSARLRVNRISTSSGTTYVSGSGAAWQTDRDPFIPNPATVFYIGRWDPGGTTNSTYTTGRIKEYKLLTSLSDSEMDSFGL